VIFEISRGGVIGSLGRGTPRPMRTRTFALKSALPLLTLGLLLFGSRPAMAIEVMCSNEFGECTVSNDGFDEIECTCADGGGLGGTGGDQYFGLTDAELLEICLDQLVLCDGQGGTDGGTEETGWGGTDGGTEETGWGGTEESGETFGDTGDGDGDSSGDGDGDGDSGDSVGDGDGDSGGDGDGDSGDGDGDGDSGGDGDGDSGDGDPGDGDGDSAGDTNTDDGDNQEGSGDSGESGTSADTGAAEDGASGCSCATTNSAPGIGLMLLSLFGLVRLRRRESLVS
jgi:MYXO-CTERM domain-containing protein